MAGQPPPDVQAMLGVGGVNELAGRGRGSVRLNLMIEGNSHCVEHGASPLAPTPTLFALRGDYQHVLYVYRPSDLHR